MAVTTPLIASLSVLGLLLGGGAAALTLDDHETSKADEDCRTSADAWACYENRVREACQDQKVEPRKPSDEAPSRPVHPSESDECRQAYEEARAEYCADHADDPRCSDDCPTDGPRTAGTDEYPSKCQASCQYPKEPPSAEDRRKCASTEEPKKETSPPRLPGVPIVQ